MSETPILQSKDLHLYYGETEALKGINMDIEKNEITALIGPSGCGKSTFLKTLDRMNDLVPNVRITGEVLLNGEVCTMRGKKLRHGDQAAYRDTVYEVVSAASDGDEHHS